MMQFLKAVGESGGNWKPLAYDEAAACAHMIARGEATEAQVAAFLVAERMKGETDDELIAFVDVMRKYCLPFASFSDSINCSGAYEGRECFPPTVPVSLLLASIGLPMVLHGGEWAASKLGTPLKDLLAALGVQLQMHPQTWERIFSKVNIGYVSPEEICPPLKKQRSLREQLGLFTMVNTVERLINPVQSGHLLIGLPRRPMTVDFVRLLPRAGFRSAYIVHGLEGSEDLPLHKSSVVCHVNEYGDDSMIIDPERMGFSGEPLQRRSLMEQKELIERIITGDEGSDIRNEREHVVFNAGLRLFWFDKVASYEEGFQLARLLLKRKAGNKVLQQWIRLSSEA